MNFIDDLGKSCKLTTYPPRKIISVVPSITELLYDLGLEDSIAGITKFCVFPDSIFRSKPRIGGTKTIDVEKIKAIKPDLIIANKEENDQSQIEQLSASFPTFVTDIKKYEDALEKIKIISELTDTAHKAKGLMGEIEKGFKEMPILRNKPRVAYMIWKSPLMIAGGDTYIQDMLSKAGFINAFAHHKRYPSIEESELSAAKVDYILLSSEPFPFKKKDVAFFTQISPTSKAILVDGTMFSWYGSRLQQVPPYFVTLQEQLKN